MPNPVLIPKPFAQDGDKNPIPLERAITDPIYRASWKAGFPPDTRLHKDVGGEAPDGLDFNGVLNIISQAVVFLQKGNAYQFDPTLAPYPIGALVRSNDNLTTYQSTVPNNSNNPNSNMTGWRIYNGSGFIVDNLTTNDSAKALSAAQGKVLQDNKLESNKVGAANGVASLDANTRVPASQLPAATISDAGVLRFATAAEAANKSNVNAAVTPSNTATIAQSTDFCINQNPIDVTSSRASGVVYQNTSPKGITVYISVRDSGGGSPFRAYINGFLVAYLADLSGGGAGWQLITLNIPAGSTYQVDAFNNPIARWVEVL